MDITKIRRINLSSAIKKAGNQAKLSDLIGVKSAYFSQIKNLKHKTNMGSDVARRIEVALNLPHGWMDNPHNDDEQKIESNAAWLGQMEPWDDETKLEDDEVELPFFKEIEASAGNGRVMAQENHGRKLRFSKNTLRRYNVQADNAYCIIVSGNSMEPAIPEGATIGIDTSKTNIKDGDIYALDHDGHLRVKVVYKMPDGIRLRSFNTEEWPDENYSEEKCKKIRLLGRVFWWSVLR